MLPILSKIRIEIFELYLQSYSLHDISRFVRVSVSTVKNVVDSLIDKELDHLKIRKIFENVEKIILKKIRSYWFCI